MPGTILDPPAREDPNDSMVEEARRRDPGWLAALTVLAFAAAIALGVWNVRQSRMLRDARASLDSLAVDVARMNAARADERTTLNDWTQRLAALEQNARAPMTRATIEQIEYLRARLDEHDRQFERVEQHFAAAERAVDRKLDALRDSLATGRTTQAASRPDAVPALRAAHAPAPDLARGGRSG